MLRPRVTWIVGMLLLVSTFSLARAQSAPNRSRERGRRDALASDNRPATAPQPVLSEAGLMRPGTALQSEPRLGVPTFLWAGSRGRLDVAAGVARVPLSVPAAARQHLATYAALYRMTPADVDAAELQSVHDTGTGPIIVTFTMRVNGIELFRDAMTMALYRNLDLVAISGYLTHPQPTTTVFSLVASEAIAIALEDSSGVALAAADLRPAITPHGGDDRYLMTAAAEAASGIIAVDPFRARRVFFRLADGLEPAYEVELHAGPESTSSAPFVGYVVSAVDGRVLLRHDFTVADVFAYRVWADPVSFLPMDGPQGTDPSPHPTAVPDGFQAPFLSPQLVSLSSAPISTSDPWLPAAATVTSGNNVDAYADLAAPDGFSAGDFRADVTAAGAFDRIYQTDLPPGATSTQQKAAVTQLFYVNNFLHDWYYDVGFDEAAGNAQLNNFGRGGSGFDVLRAEAQDFSSRNNANMATPPDGSSPRMQMFVFDGAEAQLVEVNSPAAIAGSLVAGTAGFGPQTFDLTGDVVDVNDGVGAVTDGCDFPFANAAAVSGHIALIDRNTCAFTVKILNAENSGATGVIIVNNAPGVINMGGTASVLIPSLMIAQADGAIIRSQLGVGVNVRLLRQPTVDKDGTVDNQIVAHEWGHYISNRLVGDGFGLNTEMAAGLGEGWADFHALLLTVRPEDVSVPSNATFDGAYALAAYVGSGGGSNSYYFGIRRAPYSTDLQINPLTFTHIQDGVPLPVTAPLAFGQTGGNNSEVHNTGEVWANMLWECYAALLRDSQGLTPRLTFDEARQRMKGYIVAAYKMTPLSPTLLEARDAVLAAAQATDPVDFGLFWEAFARRGAGTFAVAPDRFSTTNVGVIESFVTGAELSLSSATLVDDVATDCFPDGTLDNGETGTLTVSLQNIGSTALSGATATVTSTNPAVSFPGGATLSVPVAGILATTSVAFPVRVTGAGGIEEAVFALQIDDPDLIGGGLAVFDLAMRIDTDETPGSSAVDDFESSNPLWIPASDTTLDTSILWDRLALSGIDHRWHGPDTNGTSDSYLISPALQVAPTGNFSFSFRHRFEFEASGGLFFDGGVIELSADGGAIWSDIGASAVPGYNGNLAVGGANPLEGRSAFVATNPSYPALDIVTVSLGTSFQGQTVQVRFRVGADVFVGAPGWEIDDIAFSNITNLPFSVLSAHDATCDADMDTIVDSRDCAPADGTLWLAPTAAQALTLTGISTTTLQWTAPAAPGALAAPTYDLLRSDTTGGFAAAACLETGGTDTVGSDASTPGALFSYLVVSGNDCGRSVLPDSGGTARAVTLCAP